MKPYLRIVVLSVWVAGALCASAATLTTEDVVKMTQARLSDEVIVQTIEATGSHFYLAPKEIKSLKARGVSSRVLDVMQNGSSKVNTTGKVQSTGDATGGSYQSASTNVVKGIYVAPPTSGTYYYYPPSAYDYYYYPPPPYYGWPCVGFFFGPGPGGPGGGFGGGPGGGGHGGGPGGGPGGGGHGGGGHSPH